jgi:hypothetical protein
MFQAMVPQGGVTGWRLLNLTKPSQLKVLSAAPETKSLTTYFRDNIKSVKTVDDLMDDRRLLQVALTAFGLEGDINSKAFIRKVLAEGTVSDNAFANRLSDKRYLQFAQAMGFTDLPVPRTQLTKFPDEIITKFINARFQTAVGEKDGDLRLAMSFAEGLSGIMSAQKTDNARWYGVMGNLQVRKVFEGALGLPSSFGKLSLDQQLNGFRKGLERLTGKTEVSALSDPTLQDKLVRTFLVRSQAQSLTSSSSILGILRR